MSDGGGGAIVPDDKDWTWVIDRPCPECGFDASEVDLGAAADRLRTNASTWQRLLASPDVAVRRVADRWSVLEYACHIRDVYRTYLGRLDRMLTEIDPLYENWDQDATAIEDDYASQAPAAVAVALTRAGAALAARYDDVTADDWPRTGRRSDGAAFTIDGFTRYLLHDVEHHVWDVTGWPAAPGVSGG